MFERFLLICFIFGTEFQTHSIVNAKAHHPKLIDCSLPGTENTLAVHEDGTIQRCENGQLVPKFCFAGINQQGEYECVKHERVKKTLDDANHLKRLTAVEYYIPRSGHSLVDCEKIWKDYPQKLQDSPDKLKCLEDLEESPAIIPNPGQNQLCLAKNHQTVLIEQSNTVKFCENGEFVIKKCMIPDGVGLVKCVAKEHFANVPGYQFARFVDFCREFSAYPEHYLRNYEKYTEACNAGLTSTIAISSTAAAATNDPRSQTFWTFPTARPVMATESILNTRTTSDPKTPNFPFAPITTTTTAPENPHFWNFSPAPAPASTIVPRNPDWNFFPAPVPASTIVPRNWDWDFFTKPVAASTTAMRTRNLDFFTPSPKFRDLFTVPTRITEISETSPRPEISITRPKESGKSVPQIIDCTVPEAKDNQILIVNNEYWLECIDGKLEIQKCITRKGPFAYYCESYLKIKKYIDGLYSRSQSSTLLQYYYEFNEKNAVVCERAVRYFQESGQLLEEDTCSANTIFDENNDMDGYTDELCTFKPQGYSFVDQRFYECNGLHLEFSKCAINVGDENVKCIMKNDVKSLLNWNAHLSEDSLCSTFQKEYKTLKDRNVINLMTCN